MLPSYCQPECATSGSGCSGVLDWELDDSEKSARHKQKGKQGARINTLFGNTENCSEPRHSAERNGNWVVWDSIMTFLPDTTVSPQSSCNYSGFYLVLPTCVLLVCPKVAFKKSNFMPRQKRSMEDKINLVVIPLLNTYRRSLLSLTDSLDIIMDLQGAIETLINQLFNKKVNLWYSVALLC